MLQSNLEKKYKLNESPQTRPIQSKRCGKHKKGVIRIYLRRKKVEMNKVIIKAHSNFARRQKFDLVKSFSKYRKHYTVS